jgi:hypothetical protein
MISQARRFKRKYYYWVALFLLLNALILFVAVAEDPYRLNPVHLTIPRINDVKPRLYDYQRYVKLFDIAYQKPKTIILGSSRVLWGIDPSNAVLQKYPPVYNAGVLGPPMYEIHEYFLHALANQPDLKRVILALDFYAFNAKFDHRDLILKDTFGKDWREILHTRRELLLDIPADLQTLWYSLLHKPVKSLQENGRLTPDPLSDRELYKDFFPQKEADEKENINTQGNKKENALQKLIKQPKMKDELYQPFKLSQIDMAALQDIIETCKKRNIELYLYIPPLLRNGEIVAFHQLKLQNEFENFQRSLVKLHPYWDFASWNKITMSEDNFVDGSHHIFPVGNMIMVRILGQPLAGTPNGFGRYVTAENVEQHLKLIEQEYKLNKRLAYAPHHGN